MPPGSACSGEGRHSLRGKGYKPVGGGNLVFTTLVVHHLKTLLGHVVQFDWKKSGTKQLLHSHLTLHLYPNNPQAWGFWREGGQVLSGAGPCDHRIREERLCRRSGKTCPPPTIWHGPFSAGHIWPSLTWASGFGVCFMRTAALFTQGAPKTSGLIYQITHPMEVAGGAEKWESALISEQMKSPRKKSS